MSLLVARVSTLLHPNQSQGIGVNLQLKLIDEISDKISDIMVSTYRYNFTVKYIKGTDN